MFVWETRREEIRESFNWRRKKWTRKRSEKKRLYRQRHYQEKEKRCETKSPLDPNISWDTIKDTSWVMPLTSSPCPEFFYTSYIFLIQKGKIIMMMEGEEDKWDVSFCHWWWTRKSIRLISVWSCFHEVEEGNIGMRQTKQFKVKWPERREKREEKREEERIFWPVFPFVVEVKTEKSFDPLKGFSSMKKKAGEKRAKGKITSRSWCSSNWISYQLCKRWFKRRQNVFTKEIKVSFLLNTEVKQCIFSSSLPQLHLQWIL